ncbi:MAG TPA: hypothetical protein VMA75_03135 [Candidatus Paceibacterota bacterium]|nr:hypothetical protein [Candidatus Paceibacterota bacterium]
MTWIAKKKIISDPPNTSTTNAPWSNNPNGPWDRFLKLINFLLK